MSGQSYVSDELTHFVGRALPNNEQRYLLLEEIVRSGWLRASHREELGSEFTGHSDGGKALSSNDAIKRATVCVCDIPVTKLGIHIKKYGPFGVAFGKRFLLRFGATPVHYVARNANHRGVGYPQRTVGGWFDQRRTELQQIDYDLQQFVEGIEGRPKFRSKLSPPNTPTGHRILGQVSALRSDLEFLVFGQLKFFTVGLPEDDPENFYMEREWRIPDGFAFRPDDIARIIVPREFAERFSAEVPEYSGVLTIAEDA
jgi:hypothetical protein